MRIFQFSLVAAILFVPSMAFAATPTLFGASISTGVVVVTVLSLLAGIVNQMVQSGTFFGNVTPKSWLPWLTYLGSFLAAVLAYFTAQSPLTLDATTIFNAVMAGLAALFAGAMPGIAAHAHFVVPAQMRAARAAKVAAPTAPKVS